MKSGMRTSLLAIIATLIGFVIALAVVSPTWLKVLSSTGDHANAPESAAAETEASSTSRARADHPRRGSPELHTD
jgi:hypothetical protein